MDLLPPWGVFSLYFGLTLILEAPVYLLAWSSRSLKERTVLWLTVNAVSYPPVFFLIPHLTASSLTNELVAEVWAPLCEILVAVLLFQKVSGREKALVIVANLLSWLPGRFLAPMLVILVERLVFQAAHS